MLTESPLFKNSRKGIGQRGENVQPAKGSGCGVRPLNLRIEHQPYLPDGIERAVDGAVPDGTDLTGNAARKRFFPLCRPLVAKYTAGKGKDATGTVKPTTGYGKRLRDTEQRKRTNGTAEHCTFASNPYTVGNIPINFYRTTDFRFSFHTGTGQNVLVESSCPVLS